MCVCTKTFYLHNKKFLIRTRIKMQERLFAIAVRLGLIVHLQKSWGEYCEKFFLFPFGVCVCVYTFVCSVIQTTIFGVHSSGFMSRTRRVMVHYQRFVSVCVLFLFWMVHSWMVYKKYKKVRECEVFTKNSEKRMEKTRRDTTSQFDSHRKVCATLLQSDER